MSLVTLSDMKVRLGISVGDTTYDIFLQAQLDMISEAVEGYCGRIFAQASYTQEFHKDQFQRLSYEPDKIFTYHYPLTTITSINEICIDGDGVETATLLDALEFREHNDSGQIKRRQKDGTIIQWFTGEYSPVDKIEIIYDAGFAAIPLTVQEVVYALVEERYNKKINNVSLNFGNDVQRIAVPGVLSIDFDYTLQANERTQRYGMILGNYGNVLDQYQTERPILGPIKVNYVS